MQGCSAIRKQCFCQVPYEQLGYVNHNANNYAQAMGYDEDYPFAEFPTAVNASLKYYRDHYYQQQEKELPALVVSGLTGRVRGFRTGLWMSLSSVAG